MNLLSVQAMGLLYTVMVFLICVIGVHAVYLARVGLRTIHKKLPPEPPKIEEKKSEPVYFIVERKKKRVKSDYKQPRQIDFK